jgi:hypothetical protein
MLRRGFARFLIVALLLLGLVTVAGYFGWSQGYDAGLTEVAGDGSSKSSDRQPMGLRGRSSG